MRTQTRTQGCFCGEGEGHRHGVSRGCRPALFRETSRSQGTTQLRRASLASFHSQLCSVPSYTFQQVQAHTDQIWKFQRHDLIEEYHGRPPAPPPFILLNHLQLLVRRGLLCRPATRHKQLSEEQLPSLPLLPPWGTRFGVCVVGSELGMPRDMRALSSPSPGRREAGEE